MATALLGAGVTAWLWYQFGESLRGAGRVANAVGGMAEDFRDRRIGLVAQVFSQIERALGMAQGVVGAPFQALARGMLGEAEWDSSEASLQGVIEKIAASQLPDAIELKRVQCFLEQLIPDLQHRLERPMGLPTTIHSCMSAQQEACLRELHAVITGWLGEAVDGRVEVQLADIRGTITNPLRQALGQEPLEAEDLTREAASIAGLDLATPMRKAQRIINHFNPDRLSEDLAEVISEVCCGENSVRAQWGISDLMLLQWDESTGGWTTAQLDALTTAFKQKLKAKGIPLHVAQNLSAETKQDLKFAIELKAHDPCKDTLVPQFIKAGTPVEETGFQQLLLAALAVYTSAQSGGEVVADAEPAELPPQIAALRAQLQEVCDRGSADIYIELLGKSIQHLQARILRDELQKFRVSLTALREVRVSYRTLFEEPPQEFVILREAYELLVENHRLNERQYHVIVQAKEIAGRWLREMPRNLRLNEGQRGGLTRALEALQTLEIEADPAISHTPYIVPSVALTAHKESLHRVLVANEGKLQQPVRQVFDRVRILKDSLGDLINAVITAPRTILDTYTRPSVVAAIAIGILLLSALLSAIFSLGSLHFLAALSMAGGLSVGLHAWHRAAAHGNTETATKVMMLMAAVALDGLSHLNDKFVEAQVEGSRLLNSRWAQVPVIHHPMTI